MSQSSDDRLQFSINESVWLRDDAPAEEILSMALEPDITVEENWNDVTIKGFLRLTGEYRPSDAAAEPDEVKAPPFRTIDEIIETNEGTAVLEHHFPIDITIPSDRVPDLENLYVVIESFDYELAEHRHIQLQADIAITGLANSNIPERKEKPVQQPKAKAPEQKPAAPAPKPATVKKPEAVPAPKPVAPVEKKAAPVENPAKPAVKKENPKPAQPVSKSEVKKENKPVKSEIKPAAGKDNKKNAAAAPGAANEHPAAQKGEPAKEQPKNKSLKNFFKGKREDGDEEYGDEIFSGEYEEMPTGRQTDDEEEGLTEYQYEAFRKPEASEDAETPPPLVAFSERTEAEHGATGSAPETVQTESPGQNKSDASSLYLTKVLAGDESDQKTRVKICIVQAGESLESISERYHVPVTSLLRKNALASANIEAGELLYIPKSTKGSQDE